MAQTIPSNPETKSGFLGGVFDRFSTQERSKRTLGRLASRHEQLARILATNPDKTEALYQNGTIPRDLKVGGGVLSVTVDSLDFQTDVGYGLVAVLFHTTGEQASILIGDPGDERFLRDEPFDASDATHRAVLRQANRATRRHLANLQYIN